jgi:hypothetical protein
VPWSWCLWLLVLHACMRVFGGKWEAKEARRTKRKREKAKSKKKKKREVSPGIEPETLTV